MSDTVRLLTAEEILAADDLPKELVHVPEWGGSVYVRTMKGDERDAWEVDQLRLREQLAAKGASPDKWAHLLGTRARLAAATICDEEGVLLFTPGQVAGLGLKSVRALERVVNVAKRLNAVTDEDEAELAGNSESGPSEGSGTD